MLRLYARAHASVTHFRSIQTKMLHVRLHRRTENKRPDVQCARSQLFCYNEIGTGHTTTIDETEISYNKYTNVKTWHLVWLCVRALSPPPNVSFHFNRFAHAAKTAVFVCQKNLLLSPIWKTKVFVCTRTRVTTQFYMKYLCLIRRPCDVRLFYAMMTTNNRMWQSCSSARRRKWMSCVCISSCLILIKCTHARACQSLLTDL